MSRNIWYHLDIILFSFLVGTRYRERSVVREAVKPHGLCLSELTETAACLAPACHTFTSIYVDGRPKCARSDGLIVQGKKKDLIFLSIISSRLPTWLELLRLPFVCDKL